jgi:O-antigen/teichoic acid export membrane protein
LKRTFITNLILLVGLNLLVKPLYLIVVESEIQNRTGAENFGQYFALINFSFLLNILLDLGITNWNTRRIAHNAIVSKDHLKKMVSLRLALAAIYLIISISIGTLLHYTSHQIMMLFLLAMNQVIVSMILYFRSYLTGLHLFRQDSIISILDRTMLMIMMAAMLWGNFGQTYSFKIEWLIWGQTLSYALTLSVAIALVLRQSKRNQLKEEPVAYSSILKESFPYAALILLSMIGCRADSVILERLAGPEQSGIYAMGFRFFEAVNMISYLFAVLLLPIFSRQIHQKEDVTSLLLLSFKLLFSGIFIVTVLCLYYAKDLLTFIYSQHIGEATPVFVWVMFSALFFSLQYVTGTLITASGKLKPLIWIAFAGMIYNTVLNFLYIPHLGALGSAQASCYTQFMIFLAQSFLVVHLYYRGNIVKPIIQISSFTILVLLFGYIISQEVFFSLDHFISACIFLVISVLVSFFTGMIEYRRIPEIIRMRNTTT